MNTTPLFSFAPRKESARLLIIVASVISVFWAGQVAQSQPLGLLVGTSVKTADAAIDRTRETSTSRSNIDPALIGFARAQINEIGELAAALEERAEFLPYGTPASDDKIREALISLDANLRLSKKAFVKARDATSLNASFASENLRSQLFSLQESASHAQALFLERESVQSFRVSRTGQ